VGVGVGVGVFIRVSCTIILIIYTQGTLYLSLTRFLTRYVYTVVLNILMVLYPTCNNVVG
jgi:hypothetical protein